jgi:hypothetical protein
MCLRCRPAGSTGVSRLSRVVEVAHRDDGAHHHGCGYFFAAPRGPSSFNTLSARPRRGGTNASISTWSQGGENAPHPFARFDGRISPRVRCCSVSISIIGTLYLGLAVNWLTAAPARWR